MLSVIHDVTVFYRIGSTIETTIGIIIVAVLMKGCLGNEASGSRETPEQIPVR